MKKLKVVQKIKAEKIPCDFCKRAHAIIFLHGKSYCRHCYEKTFGILAHVPKNKIDWRRYEEKAALENSKAFDDILLEIQEAEGR
ncbi:MAG: hypothetical protein ABH864_05175 [archaeon]